MRKKKFIIIISICLASVMLIISLLSVKLNGEDLLILDALMNKRNTIGISNKEINPTRTDGKIIGEDYYNNYHYLASCIDLNNIPSRDKLDLPKELYQGIIDGISNTYDPVGDIKSYILISEILSREDINPKDNEIKIYPYHVYGSWYCEIRYRKTPGKEYDPYKDLIENSNSYGYAGPFSLSTSYYKGENINQVNPRMYAYISLRENANIKENERVLRIHPSELKSLNFNEEFKTITDGLHTISKETKKLYALEFKNNINSAGISRPNPSYLPDAVYTYTRKLRSTYQGYDIYTLNKEVKTDLESLDKYYNKYITRNGNFKSDLYFLGSVYKNSYDFSAHRYLPDTFDSKSSNGYTNGLPRLYFEMIEQFGTLDVKDIQLYQGWFDKGRDPSMFFGVNFKPNMYSKQITNKNNLVDKLDSMDTKFFEKGKVRETFSNIHKLASNPKEKASSGEVEYSIYYPLRCITNGKMIQYGVEEIIRQVYNYQIDKKIIGDDNTQVIENNTQVNYTLDTDMMQGSQIRHERLTPSESSFGKIELDSLLDKIVKSGKLYHPLSMKTEDKFKVTHSYWCGLTDNKFNWCPCPKNHFTQHKAVDLTYYPKSNNYKSPEVTNIRSIYDGSIYYIGRERSGLGNYIIIKSKIGDNVFFTTYGHLSSFANSKIKIGDIVTGGEIIGREGTSGNSTGNHLHLEIYSIQKKGLFLTDKIKYDFQLISSYAIKGE